ncbi:MAG: hypothetical protein KDG52_13420 [Rhodocyclaceae bacterium]|nr:hypothetical protein [Rhodocyclaceae bacterium]
MQVQVEELTDLRHELESVPGKTGATSWRDRRRNHPQRRRCRIECIVEQGARATPTDRDPDIAIYPVAGRHQGDEVEAGESACVDDDVVDHIERRFDHAAAVGVGVGRELVAILGGDHRGRRDREEERSDDRGTSRAEHGRQLIRHDVQGRP